MTIKQIRGIKHHFRPDNSYGFVLAVFGDLGEEVVDFVAATGDVVIGEGDRMRLASAIALILEDAYKQGKADQQERIIDGIGRFINQIS